MNNGTYNEVERRVARKANSLISSQPLTKRMVESIVDEYAETPEEAVQLVNAMGKRFNVFDQDAEKWM